MRTLIIITAIILLPFTSEAKKRNYASYGASNYGIGLEQVNNGSGHGTGYTMNAEVNKGRKALEVGIIYNPANTKVSGADFRYQIYLGSTYRAQSSRTMVKPYIQYNLMYQKAETSGNEVINLGGRNYEATGIEGMVATIGHYLGYGNKIKVMDNTYLDSSIGLGIYSGSLDKINGPGTFGYHNNNFGLTYSFKVGINYTFN